MRGKRKKRLDHLLAELHPDLSRARIQAEIMAGRVFAGGELCDKAGTLISEETAVEIVAAENPYVSRGGLKLASALDDLGLDPEGLSVIDIGSSTGGFTDCLLQRGAAKVAAVDVGWGQLAAKLRSDRRVMVMEKTNIRDLKPAMLEACPDLAVVDVSFISLSKVFPVLAALGVPLVLALVKPQFEAGRIEAARNRGVIRDPALHREALDRVTGYAMEQGYYPAGATFSRYPGPKGNIEYFLLLHLRRPEVGPSASNGQPDYQELVDNAWQELKK